MLGPMFAAWSGWTKVSMDVATLGFRAMETAFGAGQVISARSSLIGSAMIAPHKGDYRELSRMLPEKLNAGALALTGVSQELMALPLTAFTPLGLAERGSAIGSAALSPFYRGVRANVRRLSR